jgi:hypothetical protein
MKYDLFVIVLRMRMQLGPDGDDDSGRSLPRAVRDDLDGDLTLESFGKSPLADK